MEKAQIDEMRVLQQKEVAICLAEVAAAYAKGDANGAVDWCGRLQRALWFNPDKTRTKEQIVIDWDRATDKLNIDGSIVHNQFLTNAMIMTGRDLLAINNIAPMPAEQPGPKLIKPGVVH